MREGERLNSFPQFLHCLVSPALLCAGFPLSAFNRCGSRCSLVAMLVQLLEQNRAVLSR